MPPCSNPTKWRGAASIKFGMMLLRPPTVLSGQVNQADFTYPMEQFTYDHGSGSFASTRTGMELLLGTTPGDDDLGRTVIHDPASTDTVYIAAVSQGVRDGELAFADNVYFTITNFYPPFAKIPFIDDDGNEFKWRNLVLQPLQPKANSGSGDADWPDPVTGLITVPFTGAASYDLADGSLTHAWDFVDGSPASSSVAAPGNVTFPVGFRYVRHTVTSTSAQTHTEVIPVYNPGLPGAYDDMYIENFAITSHHVEAKGQQISIRIDQDIPMDEFPDNMLCMVWSRTYWADGTVGQVNVSLGPSGREHMIFIGYHDTDPSSSTGTKTGLDIETTLNFLDVAGKLRGLPGFTQLLERAATATNWHEMVHLNINREYIDYILRWHSNALEIADFNPYTTEYPVSTLGSDGMSLYDQADQRARAMACELTCDREGNLWVMPDPELLATQAQADSVPQAIPVRTSVVIITLESSDWPDIKYTRQRPPKYHWLRGNCILCAVTNAANVVNVPLAFVIAPGPVPGWGLDETEQGEQVALNLYELQFREGNRYAAILNNFEGNFEIPIMWCGDAGIDPAYKQWVQVTLPLTSAAYRALHFTDALMLPDSLEITYDHESGSRFYTMQADRNTVGYQAPEDPQPANTLPTYDAPVESPIPPIDRADDIPATHNGSFVWGMDAAHLAYTQDWLDGSPHWVARTPPSGQLLALVLDPFSPFLGASQAGNLGAWLLTSAGLYYITNLLNTSSAWTLMQTFSPTPTAGALRAPIWAQGVVYVNYIHESVPGATDSQVYVARLSANGATVDWSHTLGNAHNNSANLGMDIDQYGSDEVLCNAYDSGTSRVTIYRILNGSTGTALVCAAGIRFVTFIQKPLYTFSGAANSNTGASEAFIYTTMGSDGTTLQVFSTSDGGGSVTDITPAGGAANSWLASSACFTTDSNRIFIGGYNNSPPALWTTIDGGGSWTSRGSSDPEFAYAHGYFPRLLDGDYALYMNGTSQMVFSPDFGATILDKTGDWVSSVGAVSIFFTACIPLY